MFLACLAVCSFGIFLMNRIEFAHHSSNDDDDDDDDNHDDGYDSASEKV